VTAPEAGLARAVGPGHRMRAITLASLGLLLVMGALAAAIVVSERRSRSQIVQTFGLRGATSAGFISTFVTEQAARQQQTAEFTLSARHVSAERFRVVVAAFGSDAAGLLDPTGRLLAIVPSTNRLLGVSLANRFPHLAAAERGRIAVSDVFANAARGANVAAIAVPFRTPYGRRVFSVGYRTSGSALGVFVDHTISYREHSVFLVDAAGRLLAASPATAAGTLAEADPSLARAAGSASHGEVAGAATPSTFTDTPVPGTPWRILIAVPNTRLYASIRGLPRVLPWAVLALLSLLGALLVALFARLLTDRARLAKLSRTFELSAHTDLLTGLLNRRALSGHLARATAHARRSGEPLSVLMVDLDRFKDTNDRYGHEAGDQVLCALAECMRDVVRAEDVYGRWGGDEFLMLLPSTDEASAQTVAARLRSAGEAAKLDGIGLADGVPLSVGCTTAVHTTPDEAVRAADLDLYRAKAS
jgi:diguanylate cyclase (GGDEF)-like protein